MLRVETEPIKTGRIFKCSNCSRKILPSDPNLANIILYDNQNKSCGKVTAAEAVSKIFNIKQYQSFLPLESDSEIGLTVCYLCGVYLADMYKNYVTFVNLSKFESKLSNLMRSIDKLNSSTNEKAATRSILKASVNKTDVSTVDNSFGVRFNDEDMEVSHMETVESIPSAHEFVGLEDRRMSPVSNTTLRLRPNSGELATTLHLDVVHSEKGYECLKCDYKTEDPLKMSQHLVECHKCNELFAKKQCASAILKESHDTTYKNESPKEPSIIACKNCGKLFNFEANLINHLATHPECKVEGSTPTVPVEPPRVIPLQVGFSTVSRGYSCLPCNFGAYRGLILRRRDIISHLKKAHGLTQTEAEYQCLQASRNLPKTKKNDIVKCELCGDVFCADGLLNHVRRAHPPDSGPSLVSNSPKKRKEAAQTNTGGGKPSRRMHVKVKQKLPCSLCSKIYRTNNELKKHVNSVHLKLKPFACNICDKAFGLKHTLQAHLDSHNGVKSMCDLCGKHVTKDHLKTHLKIHLPKESRCPKSKKIARDKSSEVFPCTLCKKTFKSKVGLKRHEKYHKQRSEKAVHCPLCEKRFAIKSTLKVHLIATHKFSLHEAKVKAGIFSSIVEVDISSTESGEEID